MKISDIQDSEEHNWLVIENFHERYSFTSDLSIYNQISLKKLIKVYYSAEIRESDEIELEKRYNMETCYVVDKSYHNKLDTNYEASELKNAPLKKVGFDVICFIPLESFLQNQDFTFAWGVTNSKFGLLDREGEL